MVPKPQQFWVLIRTRGVVQDKSPSKKAHLPSGLLADFVTSDGRVAGLHWEADFPPDQGQDGYVDVAVQVPEMYSPEVTTATVRLKSDKGPSAEWKISALPRPTAAVWFSKPIKTSDKTELGLVSCDSFAIEPRDLDSNTVKKDTCYRKAKVTITGLDPQALYRIERHQELPFSPVNYWPAEDSLLTGPSAEKTDLISDPGFSQFVPRLRIVGAIEKLVPRDETLDIPRAALEALKTEAYETKTSSGVEIRVFRAEQSLKAGPPDDRPRFRVFADRKSKSYAERGIPVTVSLDGPSKEIPSGRFPVSRRTPMPTYALPEGEMIRLYVRHFEIEKTASYDLIVPRVGR